jgi:antitoxin component YwqK of YwqJK toxin-antitoxin module
VPAGRLFTLVTLSGLACTSGGDHQPSVGDSPRSAANAPGQPRVVTAADAPPPRLECPAPTEPRPIELEGSPGWACTDVEGRRNGPFFTTFPDGSTELSGRFRADVLDGPWRRLYPSGKTAESGAYAGGVKDGSWQIYTESGGLLGDFQMQQGSGVERRWYADGQLASERSYAAGVPDGPSQAFAAGGVLLYAAQFRAGVLDGPRKLGLPGQLRLEDEWVKGLPRGTRKIFRREHVAMEQHFDDDGILAGSFVAWRDRVTPRERGAYVRGERHGLWRWFDRSRGLEREGTYASGVRTGRWRQWNGGRLAMQGTYTRGVPDGVFTYWTATGGVAGTCKMRRGTGVMTTFHDNGQPATKLTMSKGVRQGPYQELSPLGKLLVEGAYRDDARDGAWIERDAAGQLVREARYVAGKLDGPVRRYLGGQLVAEQQYAAGVREGAYRELGRALGATGEDAKAALVERVTGSFTADRKSGEWITRGPDGRPALVEHYRDGVLHGGWQELEGGRVVVRGQHERGRRSGIWAWTSSTGATVRTITYDQP